jgi:subtilisin family serine protease
MKPASTSESGPLRIGIIDTGVNPWHSRVRGAISGIRIFLDHEGKIREDDDFRDLVGHGTAVAAILRQGLPDVELFAIRVFDGTLNAYPSLVARALLRAAAEECRILNLSLGMPPGPGDEVLAQACLEVQEAGSLLVAAGHPEKEGLLPAALAGVIGVVATDHLNPGEIIVTPGRPYSHEASGWFRALEDLPPEANLWGNSFACARVTLHYAQKLKDLSLEGSPKQAVPDRSVD